MQHINAAKIDILIMTAAAPGHIDYHLLTEKLSQS